MISHLEALLFRLWLKDVSAYLEWTVLIVLYFVEQQVMDVMQMELSHLALGTVRQLLRQRGIFSGKGRDIRFDAFYSVLGLYESVWAGKIVMTKVWQLLDLLDLLRSNLR